MPGLPRVLSQQRQATKLRLELLVPADLACFSGHFPQHPILPGVVQLAWAVHFAAANFDCAPAYQQMAGIKFQRIIGPGQQLALELDFDEGKGELAFRYLDTEGVYSSGRLRGADV